MFILYQKVMIKHNLIGISDTVHKISAKLLSLWRVCWCL